MHDMIYMAWRYLAFHRIKTGILVFSIALIIFLPVGLKVLVNQSSRSLMARAQSTPLIIGEKGSPLELVLNALYFESDTPSEIPHAQLQRVHESGHATAIPLYNRFHAGGFPIVGTNIDYLAFRGLDLADGRKMALLGECILGARVAKSLRLSVGDSLISSPENVFDLAGIYPLKMKVVGVLEPVGTPDDQAVFTDIKTTWIIAGMAHGHQDLSKPDAAETVLRRENALIVANASLLHYNEITADNRDSFHFHGDPATFPLTSIIALPLDAKSGTLLQGQYLSDNEQMQIVAPETVMDDLLKTVLTIQHYMMAGAALAGGSMVMTAVLVFMLSLRIRQREIETMHRIGVPAYRVSMLLGAEIATVLVSGVILAGILTLLLTGFGQTIIHSLLFQ